MSRNIGTKVLKFSTLPGFLLKVVCLFFVFAPMLARAQESAQLHVEIDSQSSAQLLSNFLVFEDKTGEMTAEQVVQAENRPNFVPGPSTQFDFNYTKSHFWILLNVMNKTQNDNWYILAKHALMNVAVYRLENDSEVVLEPSLPRRYPVSRVAIPSQSEGHFLIHVHSPLFLDLKFEILDEVRLTDQDTEETTYIAIISGALLAMIVFNFFLFTSLRDRNYFYYLLFAIVNSHLGLLAVNFPANIHSWFGLDWWPLLNLYRPLGPLTAFVFSRSFLQTKAKAIWLDRIFLLYIAILILLMGSYFFIPGALLSMLYDIYFLLGILILIGGGLYRVRQGFGPARYYILSLGCFMVGMFMYLAAVENMLPSNALTMNMHLIGQGLEMMLMSIALANKFKILDQEKTRAEVTLLVKARLLRVIAHDIANPLAVVKGMAYYLKQKQQNVPSMAKILRSVEMIEEIMGFVLKAESLGEGQKLHLESVAVQEVFERLDFLFQVRAAEKNVTLKFVLDDPGLHVLADKLSLTNEVMGNLISNAIKFSRPGGEILIHATPAENQGVRIIVKDQGIGIENSLVSRLFSSTKNSSRHGTLGEKGTGYGLPLAKSYLTAYGGHIDVQSICIDKDALNCGTTFRLWIPIHGVEKKRRFLIFRFFERKVANG